MIMYHGMYGGGQKLRPWVFICVVSFLIGATENARHENTGQSKMQDPKMRDINLRRQFARVEIAGHENAGPICRGGKCGKS